MNIDPQISQIDVNSLRHVSEHVVGSELGALAASGETVTYERWTKLPKPRGRQPKDPDAQIVRLPCRGVEDLEKQLKDYLEAPSTPAEHTTLEFVFPVSAAFMVYTADFKNKRNTQHDEKQQHLYGKLDRSAVSVIDALAPTEDPKDQMRRQKAIAKVCVEACERSDGYRYSFHNNWLSREDEACRFSYFCNDSTLNKGRAANEGAGMSGKKMRKPVYDCRGLIAIKFSQTKQSLEVQYKHIPVHKTYAERAPPPRKDSKRYKLMEVFSPDSLRQTEKRRSRSSVEIESPDRARKKRSIEPATAAGLQPRISASAGGESSPLVDFFEPAESPERMMSSAEVAAESSDVQTHAKRSRGRPRKDSTADQLSKGTASRPRRPALPGTLSGAMQSGNLTWSGPDQQRSIIQSTQASQDGSSLRGIAEAASNVSQSASISELESLKAKLEEAEQRIRRLEAEKQQSNPVATQSNWSGYPPPPPSSQYPYPYPPPHYQYPPQMMPLNTYSQLPQLPYSNASNPVPTELSNQDTPRKKKSQGKSSSSVRSFVAYTPKPPKPVLDSQKQDSIRTDSRSHPHTVTMTASRNEPTADGRTSIVNGAVALSQRQSPAQPAAVDAVATGASPDPSTHQEPSLPSDLVPYTTSHPPPIPVRSPIISRMQGPEQREHGYNPIRTASPSADNEASIAATTTSSNPQDGNHIDVGGGFYNEVGLRDNSSNNRNENEISKSYGTAEVVVNPDSHVVDASRP